MTREQRAALDEAIEKWIGEGVRHFHMLVGYALDAKLIDNNWVNGGEREIDRSLQRLRKRGVIRFVGGKWEAVKP